MTYEAAQCSSTLRGGGEGREVCQLMASCPQQCLARAVKRGREEPSHTLKQSQASEPALSAQPDAGWGGMG